jgi:hypothetical protein
MNQTKIYFEDVGTTYIVLKCFFESHHIFVSSFKYWGIRGKRDTNTQTVVVMTLKDVAG